MSDEQIIRSALSWCEETEVGEKHQERGRQALDRLVAWRPAVERERERDAQQRWANETSLALVAARAQIAVLTEALDTIEREPENPARVQEIARAALVTKEER